MAGFHLKAVVIGAVAILLAGCATERDRLADKGSLLAAAGFTARPANTPERQQSLRSLPPGVVVQRPAGSGFRYVFGDPLVCNCMYTGDAAAYGRYQQELFQRNITEQQVTAAELNSQANWDWGPWGGFGPNGFGPAGYF